MNIAIILAAGSGTRLGGDKPKQFVQIADKTILEYSVSAFQNHPLIDEICVVVASEYLQFVQNKLLRDTYSKIKHIIAGGRERSDSSRAALELYTDDNDILLFHDAARPLVTADIITRCLHALDKYNAIGVAIPATDTIIEKDTENCVRAIPNRRILCQAQTPQGFRRQTIAKAYTIASDDPLFVATDDCGVVNRYLPEEPIYLVEGDVRNMKVTYPTDLIILEELLKKDDK